MRAHELAGPYPSVTTDDDAREAPPPLMARTHTPLVAVIERDGDQAGPVGAGTAARLMAELIGGS
ncbi:hypothetical protein ACFQVC_07015 [Streptomyces monticola]|uniref:CBS domain-containing protein n=1 Tax=Streptomyces monticola TaxID=2666263 RepID=A0ABW2JD68_9ACTN